MIQPRPHADLRPLDFEVIVDTREQLPLDLVVTYNGWPTPLRVRRAALKTGDYAVRHLERYCVVERKSLDDLCGVVTHGRERFERELERSREIKLFVLVVEAGLASIELQQYRSKVNPRAVISSLYAWRERFGMHFELAGDRAKAALTVARTLFMTAREHKDELRKAQAKETSEAV